MIIVWGHNNFRLRSVQPHEIGLFGPEYDNISFDLQQKYAHLFYVPVFPLGKVWTINKGDGKKYNCPAETAQRLSDNPGTSSRKSILAWTGPLVILLILGCISFAKKYTADKRAKLSTELFHAEAESMTEQIAEVGTGQYLFFNPREKDAGEFQTDLVPFKILASRETEVLLGSYVLPEEYPSVNISYQSDFIKFLEEKKVMDSFWVSRTSLKEAVNNTIGDRNFKGVVFQKYTAYHFKLREIRETDPGPLPEIHVYGDMTSKTDYELINTGYNAYADSIVSYSDKYTGRIGESRNFDTDSVISVKLSGPGMYMLWFSDGNSKYVFVLDNTGDGLEIKTLDEMPDSAGVLSR